MLPSPFLVKYLFNGRQPNLVRKGLPAMKNFTVTLRFFGLTGEYTTQVNVRAKHAESAKKKASKCIGNRDGYVVTVCEGLVQGAYHAG